MAPRQIPVLVVGAGPTGLTMAIELARRGVRVRLIEQLAEPPPTSRALAVQSRTLELFDDMGVIDAALAAGRPVEGFTQVLRGRRLVQLDLRAQLASVPTLHTTYPRPLMLPQDQTEQILTDHLSGLGVAIERGVTFEGLVQREDAVEAQLCHHDGGQETVAARWLIGADGAHSRVRQAAGIPFPGATYAEEFIQADVRLDWELPDGQLYVFPGLEGLLAVWSMPGPSRFRIFGNVSPGPRSDDAAEPSVAEMQALLDARLPLPARIVTTTWTARYRLHRRGVPRYRQDRVFLAGDAAHVHSPAGAQGMNTGIQDAYNLAWKLAAVEHGHADPTLLDSYHRERHPIGQALLRTTDRAFSLFASPGVLPRFIRSHLLPHLAPRVLTIPAARRLAVGLISQLRIAYPHSPLNAEYGHGWRHGPRPGDRAREGDVIGAGVTRIFEVLRGTHHTVLLFAAGSDPRGLLQHAAHLEQRHPGVALARVVSTEPPATSQPRLLHDPHSTLHRAYGADQPTSFVIRPDGHIASRIRPATATQLTADLDARLGPRQTQHEQPSSAL
jgi:2-polyprenyl-6-methoxyphenol hydroxylase-like FAD-dependent oxidoreductase